MRPWFLAVIAGAIVAACSSFSGNDSSSAPVDAGVDTNVPLDSGPFAVPPGEETQDAAVEADTAADANVGCVLASTCTSTQTCCESPDHSHACVSAPTECSGFPVSCRHDTDCAAVDGARCLATVHGQSCAIPAAVVGKPVSACVTTAECGLDAGACKVVTCPSGYALRTCGGLCPMP